MRGTVIGRAANQMASQDNRHDRVNSAIASAASLFENVAITCPFALSSLTSNLAPSWATMYVLMLQAQVRLLCLA